MVDDVLLVSDVFNAAGLDIKGAAFTDGRFAAVCVRCGVDQLLSEARTTAAESVGLVTAYRCKACDVVLVETGHWGFRVDEDRAAYRFGDRAVYMTAAMRVNT